MAAVGRTLARASGLAALAWCCAGCASVVRYGDELVAGTGGRTPFTTYPAAVGGSLGFLLGVPVDVLAFPATFAYYHTQPRGLRDPVSTFLGPSFVMWKAGLLVGAPFDCVEYIAYRAWVSQAAMSPEQREANERKWDALEFTEYPVETLYPKPRSNGTDSATGA